jgi:hypothetical protein
MKAFGLFIEMKQKKKKNLENKNSKWPIQKTGKMDGFFRILEKTSFQLICTRL